MPEDWNEAVIKTTEKQSCFTFDVNQLALGKQVLILKQDKFQPFRGIHLKEKINLLRQELLC